jgi:hypothetical protein
MMDGQKIQEKIDSYIAQKNQFQANLNACEGAIIALQALIQEMAEKEVDNTSNT